MNAEQGPEGAAWERARQLRVERERAEQGARDERERANTAATSEARRTEQSRDRRTLALWVVAGAGVVALVVVAILVVSNRSTVKNTSDPTVDVEAEDSASRLAPSGPITTDPNGRRVSPSLDAGTPPVIDLSGDNFDRVWRQAQVLEGWLLRHPHAELVDQIYLPGTSTYDEVHDFIGDLQANGHAEVVENYRIVDIAVVERPAPDRVVLRYTDTYDSRDLVDAATNAVLDHEVSDGQARAWALVLRRSVDGRWQVQEITPTDGSPPESGTPGG
jgi:hypothetical protein